VQVEGTDVIVAVTADITPTDWSRPDEGIVLCSVELAASFSAVGGASSLLLLPTELKAALESLFVRSRAFDTRQLCILRGEQCWTLYIDVLVLSADGSLLDAAALATKAALLATKLPAVAVSTANVGSGQPVEVTLTDEPPTRLQSTERLPLCVTLHSFNRSAHFVLDARADEEAAAEWRLSVGVAEDGRVVSVEKGGRGAATQSMVAKMMAAARKVGMDLNRMARAASQADSDSGANDSKYTDVFTVRARQCIDTNRQCVTSMLPQPSQHAVWDANVSRRPSRHPDRLLISPLTFLCYQLCMGALGPMAAHHNAAVAE